MQKNTTQYNAIQLNIIQYNFYFLSTLNKVQTRQKK